MDNSLQTALIEHLKSVRGSFDEGTLSKLWSSLVALGLAAVSLTCMFFTLIAEAKPLAEWDLDCWGGFMCWCGGIAISLFIFYFNGGIYKFNGDCVILTRRGLERCRIYFNDIIEIEYKTDRYNNKTILLDTGREKMALYLYPGLEQALILPMDKQSLDLTVKMPADPVNAHRTAGTA